MILIAHKEGGRLAWNPAVSPIPNIISISPPRDRSHPNEKPIALMQMLVNALTIAGDTVLDPFMGSSSTGVAAIGLGRNFIGIELDEDHFNTSRRRLTEALSRPRLPFEEPIKPKQEALQL